MKKAFLLLVLLGLLGLVGWQVYTKLSESGTAGPRPRQKPAVAVETQPMRRGTIRDVGVFTGTLHPRSRFVVAPKIGGRLERLLVHVGDRLTPDRLVAVLDQGEYVQQVEQARAELEVARAQLEESRSALEIAGRELEGARALREKQIASESELDEAEAEFKVQTAKQRVARAQVVQKQAALEAAEVRLSYTRIRAGGGGADSYWAVGERFVDEGAMLAPNQAIVSVLDIGAVIAVIHVIEKDYPKVEVGQVAAVSAEAFPGERFAGRIVRLAPLLKETSRQARVEIEIPNPDARLKPGMFVRAEIEFARRGDAVLVPPDALVRREGRRGVFAVDTREMRARFVPVTLGIVSGDAAELLEPPLEGAVVTLGHHLLEDGSPVLLPGGPTPAGAKP
ncbi:MAG: efflux RND transporter periplasmic adaptor subunit [Deltaproteobacteria bacterium]|nr:efflux RND transporter periplasmic adaptor subunit [Deltaproteobacteria bacterium]